MSSKGTPPSSPAKVRPTRSLSVKSKAIGATSSSGISLKDMGLKKGIGEKKDSSLSKRLEGASGRSVRGSRGAAAAMKESDLPLGLLFHLTETLAIDGFTLHEIEEGSVFRNSRLLAVTSCLVYEVEEMEVVKVERRNVRFVVKNEGRRFAIKVEEFAKGEMMYTKGMENKVEPTPGASSRDPSALTTSSSPSNRLVDIPFAPLFAYGRLSYQTQAAAEKMKDVGEGWNVNEYVFGLSELGHSLADVLKSPDLTPSRQMTLLTSTYNSLTSIHSLGLCHQDVKAGNAIVRLERGEDGCWRETEEVLFIDLASVEEDGKLWEQNDRVVLDAKGTPGYMPINLLVYYVWNLFQLAKEDGRLFGVWSDGQIEQFKGYLLSNSDGKVSHSTDLWALGIVILRSLDPLFAQRALITQQQVSQLENSFGFGTSGECERYDMVVSRCGDLSRFFAPLCISREYLTRKGKGGKVGEEFEELLENLLIMPRNRSMLSNITIDESRHSASVHSIFGALSTSSSFEVKPAPEPNHDSESPGLSKLMVSPTRSLRGLSIAGGHSSSSSLVSTRKETIIQIKGVLEVRVIVFRFAKFEGDKGDKVIRILECPLDGCRNASGSGPWVSSKSGLEIKMRKHLAPTLSPLVGNNKHRCRFFSSADAGSTIGFKFIGEDGEVDVEYDGTEPAESS